MGPIRIRTLQPIDAEPLLKFELENRQWFERHIDARSSAFYSLEGVTEHIASYWQVLITESGTRSLSKILKET